MSIVESSYSGKLFRPAPEVYVDPGNQIYIVATPWGARSTAQKAVQIISEYLLSRRGDVESTSPFPISSCLTMAGNNIRTAVVLANEQIFREENKEEYQAGLEIFVAVKVERELNWVQVGQPHLCLWRKNFPILPCGLSPDHSLDLAYARSELPPLPSQLLGLDPDVNIAVGSLRVTSGDRLIMLSRSWLPETFFVAANHNGDTAKLRSLMAKDDSEQPFWLGIIEF